MQLKLAAMEDLPQLKAEYKKIIARMDSTGVSIWDEVYPCEFFAEDIAQERLYLLLEGGKLAAAFALCGSHAGAGAVQWADGQAKACYLDRLGVSVDYLRKGVGSLALREAAALAGQRGAAYLRLFVVDGNPPAIRLYEKNGFQRAAGVYEEVIDEALTLREFGYEKRTSP